MHKEALPGEILTAVFYKVGKGVNVRDDMTLVDIFDDAAQRGGEFSLFAAHPRYKTSATLANAVTGMIGGSGMTRASHSKNLSATPHTLGPFGKKIFQGLGKETKEIVRYVAEKIRESYSVSEDSNGIN